jgi:dolichol-phosphate mannosyltransferase
MISVIIPIHNEEEMLGKYSTRLYPAIDYYKRQFNEEVEVGLVDDGSTDASWGMIKFLAESRTDTIGVYHMKNRGMGAALKLGVRASHGNLLVFLDADLTFRPGDIELLLSEYYRNPVNCVSGSPYLKPGLLDEVHLHRLFLSKGVKVLYQILLSREITSVSPVFRLYERTVFDKLDIVSDGFEINAEIISKMVLSGMTIKEVPVTLHCRTSGKSKGNIPKSIRNHLGILWKIFAFKYLGKEW